jgi:hypothetical protein
MVLENSSNDGLHQLMCLWLLCLHILSSCICKACLTKVRVFIERSVIGRPSTCISQLLLLFRVVLDSRVCARKTGGRCTLVKKGLVLMTATNQQYLLITDYVLTNNETVGRRMRTQVHL